jgi:hypothetical protein
MATVGVMLANNYRPKIRRLAWYTARSLPATLASLELTENRRNAGMVFLVVEAEVAGKLLSEKDEGHWFDLSKDVFSFKICSPDGSESTAAGFGSFIGFSSPPAILHTVIPAPERWCKTKVFFVVKGDDADMGRLKFQVRNSPMVILDESNRKK